MSSDMDEILEIFFQECEEQLQELETGLSALDADRAEADTVNAVFRAVHSIKGGAASFGLQNLVRFAHVYENSLDGVRSDRIAPTRDVIAVFLKSMDVLSDLVVEARGGVAVDAVRIDENLGELQRVNASGAGHTEASQATDAGAVEDSFCPVPMEFEPVAFSFDDDFGVEAVESEIPAKWCVSFRPHDEMYHCGDDARNILTALSNLAKSKNETALITCETDSLPDLDAIDAEKSYLSWEILLPLTVEEAAIRDVFDWVVDSCTFTISRDDRNSIPTEAPKAYPEADIAPDSDEGAIVSLEEQPAQPSGADLAIIPPTRADDEQTPQLPAVDIRPPAEKILEALASTSQTLREEEPSTAAVSGTRKTETASIRVDLSRVDDLMDLVGELVIAQAAVQSLCQKSAVSGHHELIQSIEGMQTLTRDIQDAVMSVRAQPVRSVFQRMQRVVREASAMTRKAVNLELEGEDTEVDRTLIEKLAAPLTHMLRNAVDHGIESIEDRLAAGKPSEGNITLSAEHRSGRILITIKDDGAGVNRQRVFETAVKRGIIPHDATLSEDEINNLIFTPGFSTASEVSDLSGRGVGMDVVKQAIMSLGGRVVISSVPGKGTTFSLSLPLTLAILDGMLINAAETTMVIPISAVSEAIIVSEGDVYALPDGTSIISKRGECIPLLPLAATLGLAAPRMQETLEGAVVLVVENESGSRAALIVDEICGQTQVVIKSMEKNYRHIFGVSAATILGDGSVALILDVSALIAAALSQTDNKSMLGLSELVA
ncbi:chemotaxis protein CheA [Asaia bogorensis]|uniref:chemotaxis protein CheA n=1 Tax=Asaia bogorensis TaxID=91915 RepID=UPI000EFBB690|nr:chemotaxis protein CheA [Asaia bogorensis]